MVVCSTQGDQVHKSVFIIFFQGDQLKNRVKKICEGYVVQFQLVFLYLCYLLLYYQTLLIMKLFFRFRASLYPCPETPQERKEMAAGVNTRIDDLQMV